MSSSSEKKIDIIVINGPSSSGKSVVAKELQSISAVPLFHLSMDSFFSFIENRFHDDFKLTSKVILPSLFQSAAVFASNGAQVILDLVFFETGWFYECVKILKPFSVKWVGLYCSLEVLEKREIIRGDRIRGLAKSTIKRVHNHSGLQYDLEIMMDSTDPKCAATMINELL